MKKETDKLTFKNVVGELKTSRFFFSTQLLYFSLFVILCLLLAYVLPYSLIITIPFVIVPAYFAFSATNSIKGKKNSQNIGFFTMFRTYFSALFFGGYRLLIGLLKSLATYVASNFIIITIFDFAIFSKMPEYESLLKALESSTDTGTISEAVETFSNAIFNNPTLQKWLYLSAAISTLLAAFMFIHHIMVHCLKMRRNLYVKQLIPVKQFNFVDRRVRKDNRGFLFGSYTRTCWFIQLFIVLAGAGGVILSYFFLKEFSVEHTLIISLFLMFIVALPFMNYISKVHDLVYYTLTAKYEETFATLTLEFLTKYKEKIGIAEEDAKKIEELLKMNQEQSNKIEEEKKEDDEVK